MTDSPANDDAISLKCTPSAASLGDVLAGLACCPREKWVDELHRHQALYWAAGDHVLVEEYLDGCPELAESEEDALVLICGEMRLRRQRGQEVVLAEYQRRFPKFAQQLALQGQIDLLLATSPAQAGRTIVCPSCQDTIEAPKDATPDKFVCPSCGENIGLDFQATAEWSPSEIQRRLGRYDVIDRVGVGSFGTVYKARDPELERVVAIKIPRAGSGTSDGEVERFLREARSIAQLRHPSIVSIYEVGEAGGLPYLVSEFVEGITLADLLSARRPPPREAAQLVVAVADALHYAHQMGVIHRDCKPANIMLDQAGLAKLMDFGLAKREAADATMTLEGQILGTPAYMSPEQAKGEAHGVDGRTDVYSLGVILYQLLTGELPFRGTTRMLLHQVLHDEPRRPRSLADHVPRDLETICLRAMGKQPDRRYATARDMADDLRRFQKGEPIQARPIGRVERLWRWSRRNPTLAATTLAALLFFSVGFAGVTWNYWQAESARQDLETNLYYQSIALAHGDLTSRIPDPGRAEERLNACPKDLRGWEWDYLKRLWWLEPVVFQDAGSSELNSVAYSPDGTRVAVACRDTMIRIWDLNTREVTTIPGHESNVVSVAFNPRDGTRLASASADKTVRVWDLSTRKELFRVPGYESAPRGASYSVTFSPDGRWLSAASDGGTVRIWNASTGDNIHELSGHEQRASFVTFSPDGRLVATGSWTGTVRLWETATWSCQRTWPGGHIHPAASAAFSPDGNQLAVGHFDRTIDIWDTTSGDVRTLKGHTGLVLGVVFSPDGKRIASASEDRTVRIWDPATEREILQLRGHTDFCQALAFSPDGLRLVSAGKDGTARFWDATPNPQRKGLEFYTFREPAHEVWAVAVSRDGKQVAAAGLDPTVRVWDGFSGRLTDSFDMFKSAVFDVAFSPDGRQLAATGFDDGRPPFVLKAWDKVSGAPLFPTLRRGGEIFAVEFSPDGRHLAIGLADGSIEVLDAGTGGPTGHRMEIATGRNNHIRMRGLTFSPDGQRLAALDNEGTLTIWEVTPEVVNSKPQPALTLRSPSEPILSLAYSPDGQRLITGGNDGELTLWDSRSGKPLGTVRGSFGGEVWSVAFNQDGQWIFSAGASCTVQIWNATTLAPIRAFRGHMGPIRCLALSTDGKLLATVSADKTVKLWDASTINSTTR